MVYDHNVYKVTGKKSVIKGVTDFATKCKEIDENGNSKIHLLNEWDYEKNEVSPDDILPFYSKPVHWKCNHGHEWTALTGDRLRGRGCPICGKSHQTSFPEQSILFYLKQCSDNVSGNVKRGGFQFDIVDDVKKIYIEYDGFYFHKNRQCRDNRKDKYVANHGYTIIRIKELRAEVSDIHLDVNVYAHKEDNISQFNEIIKELCNKIYERDIDVDISRDNILIREQYDPAYMGTVEINGKTYFGTAETVRRSIVTTNYEVSTEWCYEKNGNFKPEMATKGMRRSVYWVCPNDSRHVYMASIANRCADVNPTGCPYCSHNDVLPEESFGELYKDIVEEYWDYDKNVYENGDKIDVFKIGISSQINWHWKCKKCGYEWTARVTQLRMNEEPCPNCRKIVYERKQHENELKRSLKTKYIVNNINNAYNVLTEQQRSEFDLKLNDGIDLKTIAPKSHKKFWWRCTKNPEHVWLESMNNRTRTNSTNGCPYCSGKRLDRGRNDFKTVAESKHASIIIDEFIAGGNDVSPSDIPGYTSKKYKFKCSKCGNIWIESPHSRLYNIKSTIKGCPLCRRKRDYSTTATIKVADCPPK